MAKKSMMYIFSGKQVSLNVVEEFFEIYKDFKKNQLEECDNVCYGCKYSEEIRLDFQLPCISSLDELYCLNGGEKIVTFSKHIANHFKQHSGVKYKEKKIG